MSWLSIFGVFTIVLGILALVFGCPYGIHIGAVGLVITLVGFFIGRRPFVP